MRVLAGMTERTRGWLQPLKPLARGGRAVLDLLYPPRCASCDRMLEKTNSFPFCDDCRADLSLFTGPTCARCGAATSGLEAAAENCGICRDAKLRFERTIALGEYSGLLRRLVLRAKHEEHVAQGLAELLFQHRQVELAAWQPDLIVPVPMHWRRRWDRRTNSAEVLAAAISARLGVPARFRYLRRVRSTPSQTSVPGSERFANVRRAFAIRGSWRIKASHVLLVDDVLTTGATCSEAARALREAGATRVSVAVVARSWPGK